MCYLTKNVKNHSDRVLLILGFAHSNLKHLFTQFFFLWVENIFFFCFVHPSSVSRFPVCLFLSWTRKKILQHFSDIFFIFYFFEHPPFRSPIYGWGHKPNYFIIYPPFLSPSIRFRFEEVKKKKHRNNIVSVMKATIFTQCWKRVSIDQCLIHLNKWIIDNTLKLIH